MIRTLQFILLGVLFGTLFVTDIMVISLSGPDHAKLFVVLNRVILQVSVGVFLSVNEIPQ